MQKKVSTANRDENINWPVSVVDQPCGGRMWAGLINPAPTEGQVPQYDPKEADHSHSVEAGSVNRVLDIVFSSPMFPHFEFLRQLGSQATFLVFSGLIWV